MVFGYDLFLSEVGCTMELGYRGYLFFGFGFSVVGVSILSISCGRFWRYDCLCYFS